MELRHLRYFIAVAEELNFSRAAERLHVSQPPLSLQIRDLEAELKVKLLDRNTQRVRLTLVGHAVLARSRKLVRDAESLPLAGVNPGLAPGPVTVVHGVVTEIATGSDRLHAGRRPNRGPAADAKAIRTRPDLGLQVLPPDS